MGYGFLEKSMLPFPNPVLGVAQLVKASGCGPEGRRFKSVSLNLSGYGLVWFRTSDCLSEDRGFESCSDLYFFARVAEFGRRAGLRSQFPKRSVGSSPTPGIR